MSQPTNFPEQQQATQPGKERSMYPKPEIIKSTYKGSHKLQNKLALITGGDSGIGRSVAVHYAREGAIVAIIYLEENDDAKETTSLIEQEGGICYIFSGDLKDGNFRREVLSKLLEDFNTIDILVNNAAVQYPEDELTDITEEHLLNTFHTNIISLIQFTKEVSIHLNKCSNIINTTSVTAYRGSAHLMDYSSTKGAILSFTRSLAKNLAPKGIRVNAVAPGPIWTPLIPSTFDELHNFGKKTPLGRAGQPSEVGPAYVFLGSQDASYITGQVIHVNGGEVVGG